MWINISLFNYINLLDSNVHDSGKSSTWTKFRPHALLVLIRKLTDSHVCWGQYLNCIPTLFNEAGDDFWGQLYANEWPRHKWRFPKIGVPLNFPILMMFNWICLYKPSSYWGTPIDGNHHLPADITYISRDLDVEDLSRRLLFLFQTRFHELDWAPRSAKEKGCLP